MIVIGLVAKTAAGKGTVANILEDEIGNLGLSVNRVRFSDSLREFLHELRKRGMGLPVSKQSLIGVAEAGRISFVPDFLAQAAVLRTKRTEADVCIWDGLRWVEEDLPALRSFKSNFLISVKTTNKVRYNRFVKRKENVGDENMSFKDFMAMDLRETEKNIPTIMKSADVEIDNSEDYSTEKSPAIVKKIREIVFNLKMSR